MKKIVSAIFFIAFVAPAAVLAQTPDKTKLDTYFQALETNSKFMGSVCISQHGKIIYSKAIGFADVSKKQKNTENTKFRIGSISKMFTAALIFQAVENKKLQLTDNLAMFYPSVPNAQKITIGNLLAHRSGIHNFTDNEDYLSWASTPKTEAQMLEIIAKAPSDFEPNTKSQYSNSNYVLLSYILQKIYKEPYKELLAEKIIKPLGLKNTYYGGKISTSANEALSYNFTGKWVKDMETDMSIPMGAGAVVSTPADLSRFIEAIFAGKIISAESLENMKTIKDKYGMGMFMMPFHEKTGYGHTGGIDSFSSILGYIPEDAVALAITSNGTAVKNNDIAVAMLNWVYNKPFEIPDFTNYVRSSADLDQYLGVYSTKEIPMKITVTKNDMTLVAQATGQSAFPLESTAKNTFEYKAAGAVMTFNPDSKQLILKQGGRSLTFTRE